MVLIVQSSQESCSKSTRHSTSLRVQLEELITLLSFLSSLCSFTMPRQAPRRAAAAKAANKIKRKMEEEQLWFDQHGKSPKKARVVKSVLEQLEADTKQTSKEKGVIDENAFDSNAEKMLDTTSKCHGSDGGDDDCGSNSSSSSSSSSSQLSLDLFASIEMPSSEPSALQRRKAHQKRREARQIHHTSDKRPSRRGEWRMSSPIYSPLVPRHLNLFDTNTKPNRPT